MAEPSRVDKVAFVIRKVNETRNRLRELGYKESAKNPYLFYEKIEHAILLVDTRENELNRYGQIHPTIWLWKADELEEWKRNRFIEEEYGWLRSMGIKAEFPFWDTCEDGYCKICKTDFKSNGMICPSCAEKVYKCNYCGSPVDRKEIIHKYDSPHCDELDIIEIFSHEYWKFCPTDHSQEDNTRKLEEMKRDLGKRLKSYPFCKVCGRKIVPFFEMSDAKQIGLDVTYVVEHHISYQDDETIGICQSCHSKIHHSDRPELSSFKPIDKKPVRLPKYSCNLPDSGNCMRKGIEDWDKHHVKPDKKCIGKCQYIEVNKKA